MSSRSNDKDLKESVRGLERRLREVQEEAEADKALFKRTIQHLEEKQRVSEQALAAGAADEELKKRLQHMENVLEETKKQLREEEAAKKDAVDALHEVPAHCR